MFRLIGYNLSAPFLGWIKEGHPLASLGRPQQLGACIEIVRHYTTRIVYIVKEI